MRICWHTPYLPDGSGRAPDPEWPKDWPLPRRGEILELPNVPSLWVRAIEYYPEGESPDDPEPFIYIVLSLTAYP